MHNKILGTTWAAFRAHIVLLLLAARPACGDAAGIGDGQQDGAAQPATDAAVDTGAFDAEVPPGPDADVARPADAAEVVAAASDAAGDNSSIVEVAAAETAMSPADIGGDGAAPEVVAGETAVGACQSDKDCPHPATSAPSVCALPVAFARCFLPPTARPAAMATPAPAATTAAAATANRATPRTATTANRAPAMVAMGYPVPAPTPRPAARHVTTASRALCKTLAKAVPASAR